MKGALRFARLRFVEQEKPDTLGRDGELPSARPQSPLVAGRDYYLENGLLVFTAEFLRERGYCCESGCRHCPYSKEVIK
jgi:hypothetical protein